MRRLAQKFERRGPTLVKSAAPAVGCDDDGGHGTGTMEVHVRVEMLAIELVHRLGVLGADVAVANVLADDGSILGLHQTVVAAMVWSRASLFDKQFAQQLGHGVVDELAAVVGVK